MGITVRNKNIHIGSNIHNVMLFLLTNRISYSQINTNEAKSVTKELQDITKEASLISNIKTLKYNEKP